MVAPLQTERGGDMWPVARRSRDCVQCPCNTGAGAADRDHHLLLPPEPEPELPADFPVITLEQGPGKLLMLAFNTFRHKSFSYLGNNYFQTYFYLFKLYFYI